MRVASSIVIACAVALSTPAFAQNSQAAATVQFDQGRALMKQKNYAEACEAFEKSQNLDPQSGTLFNLAECEVHLGKLATAWLVYRELGQRDTNAGRKKESNRRAKDLEKRLPKLLVKVSSPASGFTVTINGSNATSLVGIENPVDLGRYKIRATAPGYASFETIRTVAEGKTVTVRIELGTGSDAKTEARVDAKTEARVDAKTEARVDAKTEAGVDAKTKSASEPLQDQLPDESHRATSHRERNGAVVAVAGGGLLVAGTVFALRARSNWNDAQSLCPAHMCATTDDTVRGDALVDSARSDATWATGFVIGGVAIAAVGIYYAVTGKPEHPITSVRIEPTTSGASVFYGGRF